MFLTIYWTLQEETWRSLLRFWKDLARSNKIYLWEGLGPQQGDPHYLQSLGPLAHIYGHLISFSWEKFLSSRDFTTEPTGNNVVASSEAKVTELQLKTEVGICKWVNEIFISVPCNYSYESCDLVMPFSSKCWLEYIASFVLALGSTVVVLMDISRKSWQADYTV